MKNKIFILILSIMSIMHYAQCVPSATNPDSDGDGIADICDYDDDNDGILDTVELIHYGSISRQMVLLQHMFVRAVQVVAQHQMGNLTQM